MGVVSAFRCALGARFPLGAVVAELSCANVFCLSLQLTYGLTEKEITRKGGVHKLEFTDSVKNKVKEYIRQYMKKCGAIYKREKSP